MLKKVFLASAVSLLLAGVTLTAAPSESLASKSHCWKAAKDKYGLKLLKRHSYRKACKRLGRPPTSRLASHISDYKGPASSGPFVLPA